MLEQFADSAANRKFLQLLLKLEGVIQSLEKSNRTPAPIITDSVNTVSRPRARGT